MASGGVRPISITVSGPYVYVVNAGSTSSAANISGFMVNGNALSAIAGSTQALSAAQPAPGQIGFSPDGKFLVVTEKGTHKLDVFPVTNGVAGTAKVQNSSGLTPFAFVFSPEGFLVVAEVGSSGGGPNSSVSSYSIAANGTLTRITSALATSQAAACWIAIAGGTAYVANAASASISPINVAMDGTLTLNGGPVATGPGAIDLALSPDNGFLYSLSGGDDAIHTFQVNPDGTLTTMGTLTGIAPTAAGLVVR
jgi:6-phosphogluconolactonase (cycloisomerase 2 family)